mgnify:CR=1 FL=1
MKWVVDKIGKEQTWYSGDVIEKIKNIILKACECCEDCNTEFDTKEWCEMHEILQIIKKEDETEVKKELYE